MRWGGAALVIALLTSVPAHAAAPRPTREEVSAALRTLLSHWNERLAFEPSASSTARSLVALLQDTGGPILEEPDAVAVRRFVACQFLPQLVTRLETLQREQLVHSRTYGKFAESIEVLTDVKGRGPFAISLTEVTASDFLLVATGTGGLEGERWVASREGKPRQTASVCSAPAAQADRLPGRTDEELGVALARLSWAFRAPPSLAEHVAHLTLGLAGGWSRIDLSGLDDARLATLFTLAKKAGGDLERVVTPTAKRLAEARCRWVQSRAADEVKSQARILADEGMGIVAGSSPDKHYDITVQHVKERLTVIAKGKGPMKDDVIVSTPDGDAKLNANFCVGKRLSDDEYR
ncbi:MAG: hypothetical protein SFW67_24260 [Myxococcaceae bacterium]|nr:hypothetical protein [Myxococcaceae bacterium]